MLELQLDADVLRLLEEELAERQRSSLGDEQGTDPVRRVRRRPLHPSFEASVDAPAGGLHAGEAGAKDRAQGRIPRQRERTWRAQLDSPLGDLVTSQIELSVAEGDTPAARVESPPGVFHRDDQIGDLEAQVLPLDSVRDTVIE